jgi:glutamate--cysteine ligase
MSFHLEHRLGRLIDAGAGPALRRGLIGLEKEGLRVSPRGIVARTPHPAALGSALTHPWITTDYSEALLELITPPLPEKSAVLGFLRDAHAFVYENLGDEVLWAASMPCMLEGGANIPIAQYGSSNAGRMKTVYRRGLGYRYGRTMQVIAGMHFNYSLPDGFWPIFREAEKSALEPIWLASEAYMGMTRNLQRWGWLIPYLFGASPAVCKTFVAGKPNNLVEFNSSTLYYPYATSLRMGDIGYQNSLEEGRGFKANYDTLDAYVRSLTWAIETPCPDNEKIGVFDGGEYRQLNANVLQIENEHYSTIRPKQLVDWMEKPSLALRRRGVRYVELRSLDVNAYDPLGVSEGQLYFLEAFLLFCMLNDSPRIAASERREIDGNQILAAHRGREPGLRLWRGERSVTLRDWARTLLREMLPLADVLDIDRTEGPYRRALRRQQDVVEDPQLTPSSRLLEDMRESGEGFYEFACRMSKTHRAFFDNLRLEPQRRDFFEKAAAVSHERQRVLERSDTLPFDQFLAKYFAQT